MNFLKPVSRSRSPSQTEHPSSVRPSAAPPMRLAGFVFISLLALAGCSDKDVSVEPPPAAQAPEPCDASHACDLPKDDPDRRSILDAVRRLEAAKWDGKLEFLVRRLIKDGDAAYLCALFQVSGQLSRTDEDFDVGMWGLRKQADGWHAVAVGEGLAEKLSQVGCRVSGRDITARNDIIAAIANAQQSAVAARGNSPQASRVNASAPAEYPAAIDRVFNIIRKHHLTSLPAECMETRVSGETTQSYSVDVFEHHDAKCGGDPATSPRLFSFEVNRATGAMQTDALDIANGEMQPIE
ncbi:hypothetical protein [Paraburkholderia dinghuensis]|uniref:Uncharacterized protein n=1 Tax=Paraburkholderia dinghuensis TaxID=2305225 RepID=A0A3N6N4R1_9BURK|nr:hypothetical protein [Paraburkholderia dinghuensis]RQH05641.1 hypothetical protein D1Y85_13460 [Paraburkholderia dinghuensis]